MSLNIFLIFSLNIILFFNFVFTGTLAYSWGRQGHSLIGETAARVVAQKMNFELLRERAYDIGYYSNVPDFIWKSTPEIYKIEKPNHYQHIDVFSARIPTKKDLMSAFLLPRVAFNTKYTDVDLSEGRSFWRIREIEKSLTDTTKKLKVLDQEVKNRAEKHTLQHKWLFFIGVISHYVGDLSQPFHTTENFDGQKSNQNGIHAFYEEAVVDYLTPELRTEVLKATLAAWPTFHKKTAGQTTLELLYQLTLDSLKEVDPTLAIDKKIGRSNIKKAAAAYHKQIAADMTRSSLVLAELISRQLGWASDSIQFYLFKGEPDYIPHPGM